MRPLAAVTLLVCLGAGAAPGCDLNPQPLPPNGFDSNSGSGGGDDASTPLYGGDGGGFFASSSGGSSSGGGFPNDEGGPAMATTEAGVADGEAPGDGAVPILDGGFDGGLDGALDGGPEAEPADVVEHDSANEGDAPRE